MSMVEVTRPIVGRGHSPRCPRCCSGRPGGRPARRGVVPHYPSRLSRPVGLAQLLRPGGAGRSGGHRQLRCRTRPAPVRIGIVVVEVDRPNRQARRRNGKSDELAIEAARAALSGRASGAAKSATGNVEALGTLLVAKRSARSIRIKTIGQLRHLVITAPDDLRDRLGGLTTKALIRQAAALRPRQAAIPWVTRSRPPSSPSPAGSRPSTPRSPPSTPPSTRGCGPPHPPWSRSTASAPTPPPSCSPPPATTPAGSAPRQPRPTSVASPRFLPGRVRPTAGTASTKAATAMPTTPRRVVLTRLGQGQPRTVAYMQRRLAEGRTKPEIIRALKRYVHAKSSSTSLPEHREPPPGHGDGTGPRLP
jgi:transposase